MISRQWLKSNPKTLLSLMLLALLLGSSFGYAQNMFYHLLGANEPTANFTAAAQTLSESNGTFAGWPASLNSWTLRRRIVFEGAASGDVADFPILVKLNSSRITYASVQALGQDIRFADDAGNLLAYEIENWDPAADSFVWVKVPNYKAYPQRTSFWIYYGNAAATDGQNLASLWTSDSNKVFHFTGTAGSAVGNTASVKASLGTNGVANNGGAGMGFVAAPIGTAITFDGTDDWINVGGDSNLNFAANAPFTFSAMVKTTDTSGPLIMFRDVGTGNNVLGIYIGFNGVTTGSGKVNLLLRDNTGGGFAALLGPTINDNVWHDVAITRNAGNLISLFVDGVAYGTASASATGGIFSTDARGIGSDRLWAIDGGHTVGDTYLSGTIDEVRVAGVQHNVDYFLAKYQTALDLLSHYGAEETPSQGLAPVTISLSAPAMSNITIPYTVSGTATSLIDHTGANGSVVITSGQSSGSIPVRILRDDIVESPETAIFTLGIPTGASLGNTKVHTITITDETLMAPDAVDDSIDITSMNPVTLPVLANDTDGNGDLLTITTFTAPSNGVLIKIGPSLIYTPNDDFSGTDTFTYSITDGRGGSDTANVTLNMKIPFTWMGSATNQDWTNPANWLGGAVPGASDIARFNDQCGATCAPVVAGAIALGGLRLNSSFSGTIAQAASVFTIGSSGYQQRGGTFTGSAAAFTSGIGFGVTGGAFTATSGQLKLNSGDFTVRAPGTFSANGGTLFLACVYGMTCKIEPGPGDYDNVTLAGSYSSYDLLAKTMNVNGTLSMGDIYAAGYYSQPVDNGVFNLKGNYAVINNGVSGSATVRMAGNVLGQTVTGLASRSLPGLTIDSGANTVTLSGDVGVTNYYSYVSGTVATTGSTLRVSCAYGLTCDFITGTANYNNISLGSYYGNYNLQGGVVNVLGLLTIGDTYGSGYLNQKLNNGTFNAFGGISISPFGYRGTVVINSLGANSTISTATPVGIPDGNFTVNKTLTTNTLTFGSAINFGSAGQAFSVAKGIVDLAGNNLGVAGLLTIASGSKIICNGGVITAGSSSVLGELSCGTSIGITWTGATGDGLWTSAGNWTDNLVPGATDVALFTSICGANCNVSIPSNLSVRGVTMSSSYTGTITQASGATLTVGAAGWNQMGGTFAGSDAAVTLTDHLLLSGGTYNATSSSTTVGTPLCGTKEILTVTGGTFSHSNGRLVIKHGRPNGGSCHSTAQLNFPAGFTVYDFEMNALSHSSGWMSYAAATGSTTLQVANRFFDYGPVQNFNIDVAGDVFLENTNTDAYGANPAGVIRIMGTGAQTYDSSGGLTSAIFKVDKASGTVGAAAGTTRLAVYGFNLAQGSFTAPTTSVTLGKITSYTTSFDCFKVDPATTYNVNGSTTRIALQRGSGSSSSSTCNINVPAGFVFNSVELLGSAPGGGWYDYVTSATTLNVAGTMLYAGKVNQANWNVLGDITVNANAGGGSGVITAAGSTNQTVTGVAGAYISNFVINSSGGTVSLAGILCSNNNFSYTAGVVDPGTSEVRFNANYSTIAISTGTMSFQNLTLTGYVGTYNITGVVDVLGTTSIGGTSTSPLVAVNGGIIKAHGDVSLTGSGASGSATVQMAGSTNQTLAGANNDLPSLEINSTGGTVTLSGSMKLRNFTHTQGTVDAGTSSINFVGYFQTYATTPGPTNFNDVAFSGYVAVYNLAGPFKVGGILTLNSTSASPPQSINSQALEASGDVLFTSYGSGGTAPLKILGATATSLSIGAAASKTTGLVSIQKTSGATVSLAQDSAFNSGGQDLTVSSGVLDLAGFILNVNDVLTVSSGATLRCSDGSFTSNSVVNSGTIDCLGYSGYPYNWTGATADGKWSTAGNWSGGAVPSSTSTVLFKDDFCSSNCDANIDVVPAMRGLVMQSPYTGTLRQASGIAVATGNRGWIQQAGIFVGGDSNMDFNGPFSLTGGTYTATSATSTYRANFALGSSATFNHGSGLVAFSGTQTITPNGMNANNVLFTGTYAQNLNSQTMNVLGNLELSDTVGSSLDLGTINVKGNVVLTNFGKTGTAAVRLSGTSNQTVSGGANAQTPALQIASTGGTVTLTGNIAVSSTFQYLSGGLNSSAATVIFRENQTLIPNGVALANVTFSGTKIQDLSTQNMTVTNNLTIDDASSCCGSSLNNGTIFATGSVNFTNWGKVGGATIKISGSANQTVSGSTNARIPKFEIASTGGTVLLAGQLNFANNFTYTSGTVDAGTSLSVFGYNQTITPGSVVFQDVKFTGTATQDLNGGSLVAKGTVTIDDPVCCGSALNNGSVRMNGDLVVTGYGKLGTASMSWIGNLSSNITQSATGRLPTGGMAVNRTAGTVTQLSNVSFGTAPFTITQGAWDMAGFGLTTTGAISNAGTLRRGSSPSCGTITAGSYSGTAAICP